MDEESRTYTEDCIHDWIKQDECLQIDIQICSKCNELDIGNRNF